MGNQRNSKSYDEFVDKFKPRHTTDDCFTPSNIYAVVLDWAAKKYGFDPFCVVRPFCPGGDYQAFDYAPDDVVVDNPPFSIVSKIVKWYNEHGILFFLFCQGLSPFNLISDKKSTFISVGTSIIFDNGAKVNVGFVTNMGGDVLFETASDLHDALEDVNKQNVSKTSKKVTKYRHPTETITSCGLNYLTAHHTPFKVSKHDAEFIRNLDCGCNLFGGGFLLSEKAAAEKAAAEKAAAENAAAEKAAAEKAAAEKAAAEKAAARVIALSPREKELQRRIGR